MSADHIAEARTHLAKALDPTNAVTTRQVAVAAAQVEATLALAEALARVSLVRRPRWDDDLAAPVADATHGDGNITVRGVPAEHRSGGAADPGLGTYDPPRYPDIPPSQDGPG